MRVRRRGVGTDRGGEDRDIRKDRRVYIGV